MFAEHRRFNRVATEEQRTAVMTCSGLREQCRVMDLSAGGMRVVFSRPVNIGAEVYGKFHVLPTLGPFYVRGRIIRTLENNGAWESAVEFEKVSTIPLEA